MDNQRIRTIIRESIYNLINEVDEGYRLRAIKGSKQTGMAGMEKSPVKVIGKNGETHQFDDNKADGLNRAIGAQTRTYKRHIVKSFYDADPFNPSQIKRTIRKAWDLQPIKDSYGLLGKFSKEFGKNNAYTLICVLYGEKQEKEGTALGLFTQYKQAYDKLNSYTTNIESYGNDIGPIRSRIKELPQLIRDFLKVLTKITDRSLYIRKLMRNPNGLKDVLESFGYNNFNINVIRGYPTSTGLEGRLVYEKPGSQMVINTRSELENLAEFIESNYVDIP